MLESVNSIPLMSLYLVISMLLSIVAIFCSNCYCIELYWLFLLLRLLNVIYNTHLIYSIRFSVYFVFFLVLWHFLFFFFFFIFYRSVAWLTTMCPDISRVSVRSVIYLAKYDSNKKDQVKSDEWMSLLKSTIADLFLSIRLFIKLVN